MEWKLVFVALAGLFGLYLVGSVLFRPLRMLIRLAAWALVGGVLLAAINALFGQYGFHIAINPATILTAGLLQLPGVVLLVLLNCFFMGWLKILSLEADNRCIACGACQNVCPDCAIRVDRKKQVKH